MADLTDRWTLCSCLQRGWRPTSLPSPSSNKVRLTLTLPLIIGSKTFSQRKAVMERYIITNCDDISLKKASGNSASWIWLWKDLTLMGSSTGCGTSSERPQSCASYYSQSKCIKCIKCINISHQKLWGSEQILFISLIIYLFSTRTSLNDKN